MAWKAFVNPRCVARFLSYLYLFINELLPLGRGEKRFLSRGPNTCRVITSYEEISLCSVALLSLIKYKGWVFLDLIQIKRKLLNFSFFHIFFLFFNWEEFILFCFALFCNRLQIKFVKVGFDWEITKFSFHSLQRYFFHECKIQIIVAFINLRDGMQFFEGWKNAHDANSNLI